MVTSFCIGSAIFEAGICGVNGENFAGFLRECRIINRKQIICLRIGIAVIVLMGIFPPTVRGYTPAMTYPGGLYRQGEIPRPAGHIPAHYGYTFLFIAEASDISLNKLLIHWGIAGAVTFGLIYIFRDKKAKEEQDVKD